MAAARAWAAGQLDAAAPHMIQEPEAIADARRWNASPEEIEGLRQHLLATPSGSVAVWACNAETVVAFVVGATQWRTGLDMIDGRLRRVWDGLDYAAVKVSIEASGISITPDLWTGLRIMEAAARDALNGVMVH